jgi:hypothetical protein
MLTVADDGPAAVFVVASGGAKSAPAPVVAAEERVALNEVLAPEDGAAVVAAVAGAGGPRIAINADSAALKPSPLASAAGAAVASPGRAICAVVTWVEAASMAPVERLWGGVARAAPLNIRPPQATLAPQG